MTKILVSTHSEKCPVCEGDGKIKQIEDTGKTGTYFYETCHGCEGKGWITVENPPVEVYD